MNNSPLAITENQISLSNYKLNLSGYSITIVLMVAFALVPIIILVTMLSNGARPAFGFLIITGLFGLAVYFFYRLATWNKYGTENFLLSDEKVIYHPKAKNISFQVKELDIHKLSVSMISADESVLFNGIQEGVSRLRFTHDENTFETTIKTPNSVLLLAIHELEKWGVTNDTIQQEIR